MHLLRTRQHFSGMRAWLRRLILPRWLRYVLHVAIVVCLAECLCVFKGGSAPNKDDPVLTKLTAKLARAAALDRALEACGFVRRVCLSLLLTGNLTCLTARSRLQLQHDA